VANEKPTIAVGEAPERVNHRAGAKNYRLKAKIRNSILRRAEIKASKENLVPLESIHYDLENATRRVAPFENSLLTSNTSKMKLDCTCRTMYYKLDSSEVTHFGSCGYNTIAALLMRQASVLEFAHKETLEHFKVFVDNFIAERHNKIETWIIDEAPNYSLDAFFDSLEAPKRRLYQNGKDKLYDTGKISRVLGLFSKSNEIHVDKDARPRCLFNPSDEFKFIGSYVARFFIKLMKQDFMFGTSFVSGYDEDEIADIIAGNEYFGSHNNIMSYDGSSHDAHQHTELLEIVDNGFFGRYLNTFLELSELPVYTHKEIEKSLMDVSTKFYTGFGLSGNLQGTVFSGHPTRTTLFNTSRVLLYNMFACHVLGYEHYKLYASGDDMIAFFDKKIDVVKYKAILGTQNTCSGLGQLAKDFMVGGLEKHSFLSRRFLNINPIVISRDPARVIKTGICMPIDAPMTRMEYEDAVQLSLDSEIPNIDDEYKITNPRRNNLKQENLRKYAKWFGWSDYELELRLNTLVNKAERMWSVNNPNPNNDHACVHRANNGIYRAGRRIAVKEMHPEVNANFDAGEDDRRGDKIMLKIAAGIKNKKNKKMVQNQKKNKKKQNKNSSGKSSSGNRWAMHSEYLNSLHDPFVYRGVRIPSQFPTPSQVKAISGVVTFNTNALGFARVAVRCQTGSITIYNDATHNETVLGSAVALVPSDADIVGASILRMVSGGIKIRSLASFSIESGQIQGYNTLLGAARNYDAYRDSPHQMIYSKGSVATIRYYPLDLSMLNMIPNAGISASLLNEASFGVMISGAVNQSYSLQYTFNYEYSGATNTDLVPHRLGPVGNPTTVIERISGSGYNPSNSIHNVIDFFHSVRNTIGRVYNGYRAVTNFINSGNRNLMIEG